VAASVAEQAAAYAGDEAETETSHETEIQADGAASATDASPSPQTAEAKDHITLLPAKGGARRPAHYGLEIQFDDHPEDTELGRLVESTVWVNRSHPAYRRALASHSVGYHIALAVAMALAPLAAESAHEHGFVTAFLARWGEAIEQKTARKTSKR
jgi:hypothetical protein